MLLMSGCFFTLNVIKFFTMNEQVDLILSNVRAYNIVMLVYGHTVGWFLTMNVMKFYCKCN